jgi:uncharacterized protein
MLARSALRPLRPPWLRPSTSSRVAYRGQIWLLRPLSSFRTPSPSSIRPSTVLVTSQWRTKILRTRLRHHRTVFSETAQTILTPPLVFVGLLLTLWTYKCIMMVLFQDKIIYMPNMPPFSRSEKTEDYTKECKPVVWKEKQIKSIDGTRLTLCVGNITEASDKTDCSDMARAQTGKEVVICYFQGNGSSTPPRLPVLSKVLKILQANRDSEVQNTLIALSYRGYWTSSGRASQCGIELDAQALLDHVAKSRSSKDQDIELILWGQSVGSGVATTAAARYLAHRSSSAPSIAGLVLETPFSGIKSMLIAMYPQKWLPYRYLWPFLWNHWDSEAALRQLSSLDKRPRVLMLPATRDEIVPMEEADKLEKICKELGIDYERRDVVGALHNEATVRRDGQQSVAKFIAATTNQ